MKSGIFSNKPPRSRSHASKKSGIVGACVFGVAVGLIFAIALLLIFSAVSLGSGDPDALISPLSLAAGGVSFFTAGFAASKKRSAPLPCGALSGAMLCAVLWLISILLGDSVSSAHSPPQALLIRLAFIFVAVVGALIGTNSKGKRKRR